MKSEGSLFLVYFLVEGETLHFLCFFIKFFNALTPSSLCEIVVPEQNLLSDIILNILLLLQLDLVGLLKVVDLVESFPVFPDFFFHFLVNRNIPV